MVDLTIMMFFSRLHSSVSLAWFCSVFPSASMMAESGISPGGGASIIVHVGATNGIWSFPKIHNCVCT